MAKYDYSKFKDPDWKDDWTFESTKDLDEDSEHEIAGYPALDDSTNEEYWGIHNIDGRLEIDLRRFEYVCYRMCEHDYFPKELQGRTGYYIASKADRYDYTCNYLKDSISELRDDWSKEYKPLFEKIFSPKDAEDAYRVNTLCMLDSEFYDSVELGSKLAALRRIDTYCRIKAELMSVFLTKVVIEIHRVILRALSMELYENLEYSIRDLITYCNARANVRAKDLKNWDVYTKYNSIHNFLKHNSRKSYEVLKKHYPECLRKDIDVEYENGMFAVSWIDFDNVNIEKLLTDIVPFLMDFCAKVLGEDIEQAEWDYDGKFIEIFEELEDPDEHLGIYAACGISDFD